MTLINNPVDLSEVTPRDEWKQNGFENRTDSTLTFTDGTRVLSIQPTATNFSYWIDGTKYTSTGDTVTITDVDGVHTIYYDGSTLTVTANPTPANIRTYITSKALVSLIIWDATNSEAIYVGEERHGKIMSPSTHSYLHFIEGCRFLSGLGLNTMSVDGSGATADAQFGVDSGSVADEDIHHSISAIGSTTGLPIYYIDGSNWRRSVEAGFSARTFDGTTSTRLAYNQYTGGAWQLTQVSSNDFVLYHVFATTEKDKPMVSIMGQNIYTTRREARKGADTEIRSLVLDDILFPEARPIATIIFQTNTSYASAINAKVVSTNEGDNYVDWRNETVSRTQLTTSDHNLLSGLQGGTTDEYYHLTAASEADVGLNTTHRSSDGSDHSDVVANTAKVTNATHTGEVTGATTLTIASNAVTNDKMADDAIGLAELSATGTPTSSNFLRGDNSWATPAGSGNVSTSGTPVANDFARFIGATDIEGRSYAEVRSDLNVEDGSEANNITDINATDLTDGGDSALHYHSTDRARANHTGTQTASTISDFDTEVSNNTDVAANTSARHSAVTVTDSGEIDLTLTGQDITASLKLSSIDETKLDISVNASLDLADSAVQTETDPVFVAHAANNITSGDITNLGNLSGVNTGDQDISGIGTNATAITNIETKTDFITVTQAVNLDTIESDTATNNSKVTNATHTGDVTGATSLTIGADKVLDSHINWGTGATQVSAVDVPIADAGAIITATEVEGALQENRTAVNLNTTHRGSDGSDHSKVTANETAIGLNTTHRSSSGTDHSYIDQSVISGATPTFTNSNFTDSLNKRYMTDAQETNLDNQSGVNTGDQSSSDFTHNSLTGLNDGTTYQHITTTQETNFETAYTHSQDNFQAHSDYMLNTGDTVTGDYDITGKINVGEATATTPQLTVLGGSGGNSIIRLSRTDGTTANFDWSLSGGYLAFDDDTGGGIASSMKYSSGQSIIIVGSNQSTPASHRGDGILKSGNVGSTATDLAGADLYITNGQGRGNDVSSILFSTYRSNGTPATAQTLTQLVELKERTMTVDGDIYSDGGDFLLNNIKWMKWKDNAGNIKQVLRLDSNNDIIFKAVSGKDYIFQDSAGNEIARFTDEGSVGYLGIGTAIPTEMLDINSDAIRIRTAQTPASASATGNAGQICWDTSYIYVCTATNTWKRSAISTW